MFFRRQEFLLLLLVSANRSPDQGRSKLSVVEGHVNPDNIRHPYSDSWDDNWLVEPLIALSCYQHPGDSLQKQFTFQCFLNTIWMYVNIYHKLPSLFKQHSFMLITIHWPILHLFWFRVCGWYSADFLLHCCSFGRRKLVIPNFSFNMER